MKYFVSYREVFNNRENQKRESFRLQSYNMLVKFLTRKHIEGNLITDEFAELKEYFESREFTNVYFLSPYIVNENQLTKDMMSVITSSGETNSFNKIFNEVKDEVLTIKAGRNYVTTKRIKVSSADEFLEMYYSNPRLINELELTDKKERDVLLSNLVDGYNKGDEKLSVLYLQILIQDAKDENHMKKAIMIGENLLSYFPSNAELLVALGESYASSLIKDKNKYEKRYSLFMRAVELKDPRAMYLVGLCLFLGEGVEKNKEKAMYYWSESARLNDDDAISGIGVYYLSKGDKESAKSWLMRSAERGDYKALLLLDTDFDRK